jgi:hypothetical protein
MKRVIFEGGRGASRVSAENIIPPDAEKIPFQTRSYEFYVHRIHGRVTIYIVTTDYHPGILSVPVEKLIEFMQYVQVAG